jgi:hypothetical protein
MRAPVSSDGGQKGSASSTQLYTTSGGRVHFDVLRRDEMEHLHILFGRVMHRGAVPFTMFGTPH